MNTETNKLFIKLMGVAYALGNIRYDGITDSNKDRYSKLNQELDELTEKLESIPESPIHEIKRICRQTYEY